METDTITIPVPPRLAKRYREATPEMRRKWDLLLGFQLKAILDRPRRPIEEIMSELGRQAAENGLTQEILDDILREWDEERKQRKVSPDVVLNGPGTSHD